MKNKNKNIAKFFSEKLPDPEIPADEAWGNLNDMLDKETEDLTGSHFFKGSRNSTLKVMSALVLLGVVIFSVFLFLNRNEKSSSNNASKTIKSPLTHLKESDKASSTIDRKNKVDLSDEPKKTDEKGIANAERSVDTASSFEKSSAKDASIKNITPKETQLNVLSYSNAKSKVKRIREEETQSFTSPNNRVAIPYKSIINATTESYKRSEAAAMLSLKSLPYTFASYNAMLEGKVNVPFIQSNAYEPKKRIGKSFDMGLEWNLNAPLKQTDFLFTSIDSVRKPTLLLIPGIYLSKYFKANQSLTLTLSLNQPYFGNSGRLIQVLDSIPGPDSSFAYRNTNLIKTFAFNAALQYQYQFAKHFSVGAGVAYSRISGALIQEQGYSGNGEPSDSKLLALKSSGQISQYLKQDVFYFKAGVSYKIGRFQTGINILAPVSNVSASPGFPVRPVNGQFYLRFRVW